MASIWKDPSSIEPQGWDYTTWLATKCGPNVYISNSLWSVSVGTWDPALGAAPGTDPSPLTLSGDEISEDGRKTQVNLSGGYAPAGRPGTKGYRYWVTNHFTTSNGVQDERSFEVLMVQR